MRSSSLIAALLAVTWTAGCGEDVPSTAPDTGPGVPVPGEVREEVPDPGRLPALPLDIEAVREVVSREVANRTRADVVGTAMLVVVPDPAHGIFNCQDGVGAAAPGAIIQILPGTFTENIVVDKCGVTFAAQGAVQILGTILVTADDVTVRDFVLTRPPADDLRVGIYVGETRNVRILDNTVSDWSCAVVLDHSIDAVVQRNVLKGSFVGAELCDAEGTLLAGNTMSQVTFGAYVLHGRDARIRNNDLSSVRFGFALQGTPGNVLLSNVITADETGLCLMDSWENTVAGNTVTAGLWGMDFQRSHRNRISDNRVLGAGYDGLFLMDSDLNIIKRNDLLGEGDDGIDLHGTSSSNRLIGTVALGHANTGIELERETSDNFVTKSRARGNRGCDIVNYGTANVFTDNDAGCTFGI